MHPTKVAILEALNWIGEPLSATLVDEVFDRELGVSLVAYHMGTLTYAGLIEFTHQSMSRGAPQTFYRLSESPLDQDGE